MEGDKIVMLRNSITKKVGENRGRGPPPSHHPFQPETD
jgi:hypothetical protein